VSWAFWPVEVSNAESWTVLPPVGAPPLTCNRSPTSPVEIEPNPVSDRLFSDPTLNEPIGTPASALPVESSDQSAPSIGQLDAGYHSACNCRASTDDAASTNTFNVADNTVAPAGSADASKRNNPVRTV
jgi:hypothetical protein